MVNFININFNLLIINELANPLILNQITDILKISLQINYKRFGKYKIISYIYIVRLKDKQKQYERTLHFLSPHQPRAVGL